ncbi:tRNA 2-thiouridine(34) synthase MnmA [Patescibacteria group bacterium]|nr:tRNA 2-thiouridine(34) synthase MnmA [Patescibacteria group bacterium]MBU1705630.1 tRNA 2-thiouridine(34) synthase MnmA [Patescibacteria group bacterium]
MSNNKPKVLVGMSGGVDSSVTAALLLEQGYEVIGGFMKNWSEDIDCEGAGCTWREDRRDATKVAARLGIPLHTFDFEKEYRRDVVDYMFKEFEAGRTPNPDVMCNKFVKFDLFMKEADKLGCDFVATGHYARIKDGKILAGKDKNKDQTYFLWAIPPEVLPRVLFPVGELTKPEVRQKAKELDLPTADKKDSTGICFIGEIDVNEFLKTRIPENLGRIITTSGEVVGEHKGLTFYTIGQRQGLNIGGTGIPYYVVEKRPDTNELVVGSESHPALFRQELTATDLNWFNQPETPFNCQARIRYRQPLQACVIESIADTAKVKFKDSQRAVTAGQSIVFYDGEEMIGGGIIE